MKEDETTNKEQLIDHLNQKVTTYESGQFQECDIHSVMQNLRELLDGIKAEKEEQHKFSVAVYKLRCRIGELDKLGDEIGRMG